MSTAASICTYYIDHLAHCLENMIPQKKIPINVFTLLHFLLSLFMFKNLSNYLCVCYKCNFSQINSFNYINFAKLIQT